VRVDATGVFPFRADLKIRDAAADAAFGYLD
jgi:hypothetical protein